MKLTVYTSIPGGQVHIHETGCADLKKSIYKNASVIEDGRTDWGSKEEYGLSYWSDINDENPDDDPYVFEDLKFFPCTNDLPASRTQDAAEDNSGSYSDPDGYDRNGAYDGFQVTSDAEGGL